MKNDNLLKFSGILWRVWAIVAGFVMVSTLGFALLTSEQLRNYVESSITESLNNHARLIRVFVSNDFDFTDVHDRSRLKELSDQSSIRLTIIADSGIVIFDNQESAESMDNHASRPEIREAQINGMGIAARYSETLEKTMLYLALPLEDTRGGSGFVRASVNLSDVDQQVETLRSRILLSGAGIALLALVASYFFAAGFTRPIRQMTEMSVRVAGGDYRHRLSIKRDDELGRLSIALNQLARGAENRIDALEESKNQLEAILSGLTEGVIAFDGGIRILHMNESAKDLLGIDSNLDPRGMLLGDIVRSPEVTELSERCFAESEIERQMINYEGRVLDVSVFQFHQDTTESGAIMVLEDMTSLRRLEKIRTDFVANASHELKTPVTVIKGYVETIEDDNRMPDSVKSNYISRIGIQAERLTRLVQDLISLSRLDGEGIHPDKQKIDLNQLIQEVFASKETEARENGVKFSCTVPDSTLFTEGESTSIWQILINLIDNAIVYTSSANVRESTGNREPFVLVEMSRENSDAVIKVIDNGIGISREHQERVFERFYRVDKARSREMGGTGLGLSIVRNAVEAHGGSIGLESEPGKGSTFIVRLPLD